jgi:hypothetical protein
VVVDPIQGPPERVVIFLHGRDDEAHGFRHKFDDYRTSQGKTVFEEFPTFRWVFLNAPHLPVLSMTQSPPYHVRPQWFDE